MLNKILSNIKHNWKSGLTVSLVSIPLSISLAVASNSTPTAGIITAIWAGLLASIFGGSNYNIVGPTGALSGILATYALAHGAPALSLLAIVSGILIILAFYFHLERYLVFIPASAVHGFTLGVALIIGLNQLNFAFGLNNVPAKTGFIHNVFASLAYLGQTSWPTFLVFIIFLVGLFIFAKLTPKLPGSIILAPIGILLGWLSYRGNLPFTLLTLGDKYHNITPTLFTWNISHFSTAIFIPAITVAIVAILETMISAKIADGMTKTKHDRRKEVFGLGIANVVSGLTGGIPATAALARTALNVKTGADHKTSATISSFAIAAISIVLLTFFKYIPLAVIASILVFVAINMVGTEHFGRMFKLDKKSFFLSLLVAFVTIYEDPIFGILVGTAIALLLFMSKLSKGQFELIVNDENKQMVAKITGEEHSDIDSQLDKKIDTLVYSIKGQLAYINAQAHITRFESSLNGYNNVILRLRELYFIDLDGVDAFEEIVALIHKQKKKVLVSGVSELIAEMLEDSPSFNQLKKQKLIFSRTTEALKSLGYDFSASYRRNKVNLPIKK